MFVGARVKYAYRNKVCVILLSAFHACPIDRSVHHWVLFDLSFYGIVWGGGGGREWASLGVFLAPHYIFMQWFQEQSLWPWFPVGHRNTAEAQDSLSKGKGGEWRGRSILVNSQETSGWWLKQLLESEWTAEYGGTREGFWTVKLWRDLEEGEAWLAGPTEVRDDAWTNLLRYFWQWGNFASCFLHILSKIFGLAHVQYVSGLSLSTAYVSVFDKPSICFSALNPGS